MHVWIKTCGFDLSLPKKKRAPGRPGALLESGPD
jgi:hypothetical protein